MEWNLALMATGEGHNGPSKESYHEHGKDLLTAMSSFYDVSTSSFNMLFLINSIVSSSWFSSARFNACRNAFFALENSPVKDENLILKLWSHYPLSTNYNKRFE